MAEDGNLSLPRSTSAIDSIGRGTTVMIFGTVTFLLLGFIVRVELARHLSLEAFGSFNLGLALASLLTLMALLGLHSATARTLAGRPDPAVRLRLIRFVSGVTVVTAVVASTSVYLLAGSLANLFNPAEASELTSVFQLFSITIGFTLLNTLIAAIFQGFEDTVPNAWINQMVQPASFLVFLAIFIYYGLSLNDALVSWVASNAITFVALLVYAFHRLPRYIPPATTPAAQVPKGLWSLSVSLWGVTTLAFLTAYVDTLILGAFWPEEQVGIYSAEMTLARLILVASGAVTYIFLPVAARLQGEGDIATIRETYPTVARWILVVTTPLFLDFGLLPVDASTAIFGPAYAPGSTALVIITLAAIASVAFGPVNATLAGMGMTRPLLIATVIAAVANVVLSLTLIPQYGLLGAAVAWSAARVLYPGSGATALYREHRITTARRRLLVPFGVTLAIGVPLFLSLSLVPHGHWIVYPMYFVGLAIFLVTIFGLHAVDEGDLFVCRLGERVLGRPLPRFRAFLVRHSQPRVPRHAPSGPSAKPRAAATRPEESDPSDAPLPTADPSAPGHRPPQ